MSVADLGKKLATGKRITKDLVVNDSMISSTLFPFTPRLIIFSDQ
jgi:hypothetical protein